MPDTDSLVEKHIGTARRLASSYYRSKTYLDRMQLESDAALGLWQAVQRYNDSIPIALSTYAARRMIGQMIDGQRLLGPKTRSNHQRFPRPSSRALRYRNAAATRSPDRMALADEAKRTRSCLSITQRLMVVLYFLEDLSMREIAEALSVSESWVSLSIKDALKEMRLARRKLIE